MSDLSFMGPQHVLLTVIISFLCGIVSLEAIEYCDACFSGSNQPAEKMPKSIPMLVITGAQKSGTTYLHAALSQAPGIASAFRKELHYLNRPATAQTSLVAYVSKWAMKGRALITHYEELSKTNVTTLILDKVGWC